MTGSYRLVVPVRPLAEALPRFAAPADVRRVFALAFARDTIRAAVAAPSVREVCVLSEDDEVRGMAAQIGASVIDEPEHGILAASLERAQQRLTADGSQRSLALLMGDLPCLTPSEVDYGLAALRHGKVGALDLARVSATLISGSLEWRRLGPTAATLSNKYRVSWLPARQLQPGLACDVDTVHGLRVAEYIGVGPATAVALKVSPLARRRELSA